MITLSPPAVPDSPLVLQFLSILADPAALKQRLDELSTASARAQSAFDEAKAAQQAAASGKAAAEAAEARASALAEQNVIAAAKVQERENSVASREAAGARARS